MDIGVNTGLNFDDYVYNLDYDFTSCSNTYHYQTRKNSKDNCFFGSFLSNDMSSITKEINRK